MLLNIYVAPSLKKLSAGHLLCVWSSHGPTPGEFLPIYNKQQLIELLGDV